MEYGLGIAAVSKVFYSVANFIYLAISRLCAYISSMAIEIALSDLIIVSAKSVPEKIRERILIRFEQESVPFKIHIWGPEEINKIASQHRAKVNEIANNLFALRLETAVSKPAIDWKSERDKIVITLRESYQKGQFSLFLGAGVSSSAGMPDWNTLLSSLFVTYLTQEFDRDVDVSDKDISELVNRLNVVDEPSALMAARYLRKGLVKSTTEAKDFKNAITKNLYKLRNSNFEINSRLIKSIACMCIPRRTGAKVRSIITYNFDDLLERQLTSNNILHSCIYSDRESYDPDELPVYHVHGFLPEERNKYEGLDNSTLVFSEEGYHQIYSDTYHWSNLVQLNSLRENNCLMVGFSMTDPNLRRLLDISARNIESSKHYVFMKRLTLQNFAYDNKQSSTSPIIKNLEGAEKFLQRHHTLNEELMKELGVTIIWYEDYDDIPLIIEEVTRY
ncbi:SIR2 family protein [Acinetobacter bereziniae]|uniref:SIR2 family protein n=1 Tax=Acinetobacter bereziniae TaxID=106648 RepID=UPI001D17DA17|nr:SIR2 family protein [Acinetobacter bereziniae]